MDLEEIALSLLSFAAKIAPTVGEWIADLVDGKDDPMSLRVKDILPEESKSAQAAKKLRAMGLK